MRKLAQLRKQVCLTRSDLAKKMRVSSWSILRAEFTSNLHMDMAAKYAKFFDVNTDALYMKDQPIATIIEKRNDEIINQAAALDSGCMYTGFGNKNLFLWIRYFWYMFAFVALPSLALMFIYGFFVQIFPLIDAPLPFDSMYVYITFSIIAGVISLPLLLLTRLTKVKKGFPRIGYKNSIIGLSDSNAHIYIRTYNGYVKSYDYSMIKNVQMINMLRQFKVKNWTKINQYNGRACVVQIKFADKNYAYVEVVNGRMFKKLNEIFYVNTYTKRKWHDIVEKERTRTLELHKQAMETQEVSTTAENKPQDTHTISMNVNQPMYPNATTETKLSVKPSGTTQRIIAPSKKAVKKINKAAAKEDKEKFEKKGKK